MRQKTITIFLVIAILISLFSSSIIIYSSYELSKQERGLEPKVTDASINLCIDIPFPILDPIGDQNTTAGTLFTYDVNATSPSNDVIYFYDDTELFDIDKTTGLISFTPTEDNVAVHIITISARHDICEGSGDDEIINFVIYSAVTPAPPITPTLPGGGGTIYCKENWSCGFWGECKFYLNAEEKEEDKNIILELCEREGIDKEKCGFRERICIDVKNCGQQRNKPQTMGVCYYIYPPLPPVPPIPPAIPPRVPLKCGDKFCEVNELFTCLRDCWPVWVILFLILSLVVYLIFREKIKKRMKKIIRYLRHNFINF